MVGLGESVDEGVWIHRSVCVCLSVGTCVVETRRVGNAEGIWEKSRRNL